MWFIFRSFDQGLMSMSTDKNDIGTHYIDTLTIFQCDWYKVLRDLADGGVTTVRRSGKNNRPRTITNNQK